MRKPIELQGSGRVSGEDLFMLGEKETVSPKTTTLLGKTASVLGKTKTFLAKTAGVLAKSMSFLGKTVTVLGKSAPFLGRTATVLGNTKTFSRKTATVLAKTISFHLKQRLFHIITRRPRNTAKRRRTAAVRADQGSLSGWQHACRRLVRHRHRADNSVVENGEWRMENGE